MLLRELPEDNLRQLVSMSPLAWGQLVHGDWFKPYPWVQALDRKLVKLGVETNRLRVSCPPQVGKTLAISHNYPTWRLVTNPDCRIIVVSYGEDRAVEIGGACKDIIKEFGHLFDVQIDPSTRKKDFFKVAGRRGYIKAVGIQGSVTGFSADEIIFDDPYKNPDEAWSPTGRRRVERFFNTCVRSRLQADGNLIVLHTRWHRDDLIGYTEKLEAGGGQPWDQIRFQAIAEADQVCPETGKLFQRAGESICEDLKPVEWLRRERDEISYQEWMSLYQQTPVAPQGTLWDAKAFTGDVFVEEMPYCNLLVVSLDPAMGSEMSDGDYSAITAVGVAGDGYVYVESDIERSGPEETVERLVRFCQRMPRVPDAIGFESVGFQKVLADQGVKKLLEQKIFTQVHFLGVDVKHPVTGKRVVVKKQDRIMMRLDPLIRDKMFRFVRNKGCAKLIDQLEHFPMRKYHDDGPDSLEQAVRLMKMVGDSRTTWDTIMAR